MNAEVEDGEEIGLLDLLTMVGEEKWAVLGVTLAATLTGLIVSLIVTPIFSSTALIMPAPQGGGGAGAAALAQLAQTPGLGALGGVAGGEVERPALPRDDAQPNGSGRFDRQA